MMSAGNDVAPRRACIDRSTFVRHRRRWRGAGQMDRQYAAAARIGPTLFRITRKEGARADPSPSCHARFGRDRAPP